MRKRTVLFVDDDEKFLKSIERSFIDETYTTFFAVSGKEALEIMKQQKVYVLITDMRMPEMNGLDLLEKIYAEYPSIPVIIVTAVNEVEIALRAVKLGAYEFITKPPDTDRLFLTIQRALSKRLLESERDSLRKAFIEEKSERIVFSDLITDSALMYKVFELVEIFAPTNETVLITGETGTGKDLIAKKIHDLSPRRDYQFIPVNLASISTSLFESELFGHRKGTFTGAGDDKMGYFESANKGTIFLDEIGELPLHLQGKLLRTIQYNEVYRIGDSKPVNLDIRIVSASNKDLLEAVRKKEFRADLYYRLNRGFIHLPPLSKRGNDVVILAEYFLEAGNKVYNRNILGFSEEVLEAFKNYTFPGNIRELENIIMNAVVKTSNEDYIKEIDLPAEYLKKPELTTQPTKLMTLEDAEEEHILNVMKYVNNSVQSAAPILGVSERTLQRRLKTIRDKTNLSNT